MESESEIDWNDFYLHLQALANKHETVFNEYVIPNDSDLARVRRVIEKTVNTPQYTKVVDMINSLHRPSRIIPGTIGSYIWGCFNNYYGDVGRGCSALCTNSIPNLESEDCQYQIWCESPSGDSNLRTFSESNANLIRTLTKQSDAITNKAYIYVNDGWKSFTQNNIDKLRENGIRYATVLNTENSKHDVLLSMVSLDELPVRVETKTEIKSENTGRIYYYIFLFIIIMLILGYFQFK